MSKTIKNIHNYTIKLIFILIVSLFCIPSIMQAQWDDYYWQSMTILPANINDTNNYFYTYWYELYFLPNNSNYGFACGSNGSFAKTTDGGRTWYASTIKEGFHAESIHFADENIGYISGPADTYSFLDSINSCIFKTIDGGKTWTDITPKEMDGRRNAWGHYITDENNIWFLSGDCYLGDQIFYKSTDGGINWTFFKTYIEETALTDVVMYDKNGLGYAVSSGIIWQTLNGGINWNIFSLTPEFKWDMERVKTRSNWHEDLQIYNKSFVIPVSATCSGSMWDEGGMAFSADNCQSWTTFKTNGSMFGSFILSDSIGWVCGTNQEVYYTLNAGKEWIRFVCGIPSTSNLDDLWFINDTTGFVCGEGGIYKLAKKKNFVEITLGNDSCYQIPLIAKQNFNHKNWYKIAGKDTIYIASGTEIMVHENGQYFVEAFDVDCYSVTSNPVNIIIPTDTVLKLAADNLVNCDGDTVNIWFEPRSYIANFYWSENNVKTDTLKVTKAGEYSLFYTDTNMCQNVKTITIDFTKNIKPQLEFANKTLLCSGDTTSITIKNFNNFKNIKEIIWYKNNIVYAKDTNKIIATESGDYHVYIGINNHCFSESDTISLDFKQITNSLVFEQEQDIFFIDSVKYSQMSCRNLNIKNISSSPVYLDNIYFLKKLGFTTPMEQFPIAISPNNTKEVLICYSPTNLGIERDTILIVDNCSTHSIPLSGIGIGNKDSIIYNCNMPINISTKEIVNKKNFTVNMPIPNPAELLTKINYSLLEAEDQYIKLFITNYLGQTIQANYSNNIIMTEVKSDDIWIDGEIEIETNKLQSGIYFIRLEYNNTYQSFVLTKK